MCTGTGLLGPGPALVVGLPASFDLRDELRKAREVWLATAFAHDSGWRRIRDAFAETNAECVLIAGRSFGRTEPTVLRQWLRLSRSPRVMSYLFAPRSGVFHPKVLLVIGQRDERSFAIVGSGNLSSGGLKTNVECGLFTRDRAALKSLRAWFLALVGERASCIPLTSSVIDEYTPDHEEANEADRRRRRRNRSSEARLRERNDAYLANWSNAVREARRHIKRDSGGWRKKYLAAVRTMKSALRYPDFDFDEDGWNRFYGVPLLGRLVPVSRPRVWRAEKRFKRGLRQLIDESLPVEERVDAFLRPQKGARIVGVGINTVSKILAIHDKWRWPVLNGVAQKALRSWGYEEPRGGTPGQKYAAFADLMRRFRRECEARDLLDVDSYIYEVGSRLQ